MQFTILDHVFHGSKWGLNKNCRFAPELIFRYNLFAVGRDEVIESKAKIVNCDMLMLQKESIQNLILDKGIFYVASKHITRTTEGRLNATGDDPQLIFWIPYARKKLSFTIQVAMQNQPATVVVYYSHSRLMRFDEQHKLVLTNQDDGKHQVDCSFDRSVTWIRIDPVDAAGLFEINALSIIFLENKHTADNLIDLTSGNGRYNYLTRLRNIKSHMRSGFWKPDNVIVFVTHEISGTGAPLLCRKISSQIRKMNMRCIIISLTEPHQQNFGDKTALENDCDELFICPTNESCNDLIRQLARVGVRLALLNTVLSGKVVHIFKNNGFNVVSLIHEMKSSCKILRAESSIKQISDLSDVIIFPAKCVMDDFLSFGHPVMGKCLIRPQGFYKNVEYSIDNKSRLQLIDQLCLPTHTQFVCGAGSINFGKGVDLLAMIAKKLVEQENGSIEFHFFWIGSTNAPEYAIWVKDQIERMGLSERFHFIGYISDDSKYVQYLSASLIYALVSREDSFPSTMVEAMAWHVPVIAFKGSGGAEETLSEERGFLTDYLDIDTYADIICQIGNGQRSVASVVEKASIYVQRELSFSIYVEFLMAVLHEII